MMKNFILSLIGILSFPLVSIAQQWPVPPTIISTPGQSASNPEISIDPNGNVVAVWLENGVVISSSGTVSGGWGSTLSTLSGSGASSPQVQINLNGLSTAIWEENGVINTASLPLNGSWSSETALSGSGASLPQLAIDSTGNLVAVWVEGGVVRSATQLINGSWSAPETLSSSNASVPQVSIGANGTVVAVWQETVVSTPTIYAISKAINGSWGTASAISTSSVNSAYPKIAVDVNGNATAIWFSYALSGSDYSDVIVQSATQPFGGSWGSVINVSAAGLRDPSLLTSDLISSLEGAVLAVWVNSYDEATFDIESSVLSQGSWTTPISVTGPNLLAYALDLSIDAGGDAGLIYMFYDADSSSLIIQQALNNIAGLVKVFLTPWTLSAGGNNGFPVSSINTSSGGLIFLADAWVYSDGLSSNTAIQALLAEFLAIQPPSNLTVVRQVQNFGVLTEQENLLTWNASPSSDILSYSVFRNSQWISTVLASVLQYSDSNRPLHETVIYEVAATDSRGCQSSNVSFTFTN